MRHGAVMGLVGVAKPDQLVAGKGCESAVRVGAVLASRLKSPLIASFSTDADNVALEAAGRFTMSRFP